MICRMFIVFSALTLSLVAVVAAQERYPTRAVTLVVPFPPGGMADHTARPLATALEKHLKQSVVVMNRPGASGAVGIQAAGAAKPDGHTILVTLVSFSSIPQVDAIFNRAPAYSVDQFEPMALLAADPPSLVVGEKTPWKTLKELIVDAKARPGQITYSHSGLYGPAHLPMEMFLHAAGIKMRQIPAVGGAPAMMMVLGNNADMWASVTSIAAPHVSSGKVRVLASWGQGKHPTFPDAPTLKDSGYDVEFYVWSGVFVQKGVPAEIQKVIRDAIRASINSEEFKSAMTNLQIPVDYRDAPEFKTFLERDAAAIREAIRRMGKIEETK